MNPNPNAGPPAAHLLRVLTRRVPLWTLLAAVLLAVVMGSTGGSAGRNGEVSFLSAQLNGAQEETTALNSDLVRTESALEAAGKRLEAAKAEIEELSATAAALETRATELDTRAAELASRETAVQQAEQEAVSAAAPVAAPTPAPAPAPAPAAPSAYFDNCTAARAAGAAPVRVGDAGYGRHLDRDGDGVGCE